MMERGDRNKRGEKYISVANKILNWYILFCLRSRVSEIVPIRGLMYPYDIESNQGDVKQQKMLC